MIKANPKAKISVFLEAIKAVGIYDRLTGPSFTGTLFIPNDAAFAVLLSEKKLNATKSELLAEKELLTTILLHHVTTTIVPNTNSLKVIGSLPTLLSGRALKGLEYEGKIGVWGELGNFAAVDATSGIQGLIGSGAVSCPSGRAGRVRQQRRPLPRGCAWALSLPPAERMSTCPLPLPLPLRRRPTPRCSPSTWC